MRKENIVRQVKEKGPEGPIGESREVRVPEAGEI